MESRKRKISFNTEELDDFCWENKSYKEKSDCQTNLSRIFNREVFKDKKIRKYEKFKSWEIQQI